MAAGLARWWRSPWNRGCTVAVGFFAEVSLQPLRDHLDAGSPPRRGPELTFPDLLDQPQQVLDAEVRGTT